VTVKVISLYKDNSRKRVSSFHSKQGVNKLPIIITNLKTLLGA